MKLVRAALGENGYLRARGAALVRSGVGRGYPELLDGIEGGAKSAFQRKAFCLIIIVHTVAVGAN